MNWFSIINYSNSIVTFIFFKIVRKWQMFHIHVMLLRNLLVANLLFYVFRLIGLNCKAICEMGYKEEQILHFYRY